MSLSLTPLIGLPFIQPGQDLSAMIIDNLSRNQTTIEENDILVITQKVISKSENRYMDLTKVQPSNEASRLAAISNKDPRLVEVILSESSEVIRAVPGNLIVRHRLGFICANAGVDHSNIDSEGNTKVLQLPLDPSGSAAKIRSRLMEHFHQNIGVLVIDTHGRAWRNGVVGITIGGAGVPMLSDQRGWKDLMGGDLRITQVAVADELAAAASLVMGQANEGKPIIHVRGFPYPLIEQDFGQILRDRSSDLFL